MGVDYPKTFSQTRRVPHPTNPVRERRLPHAPPGKSDRRGNEPCYRPTLRAARLLTRRGIIISPSVSTRNSREKSPHCYSRTFIETDRTDGILGITDSQSSKSF